MFVKKMKEYKQFVANDDYIIRKLLHPATLSCPIAIATVDKNQKSYAHKLEQRAILRFNSFNSL